MAYDLFVLQDNDALPGRLIDRLKLKEGFQGARHEVFSAATCIRAGFKITYEDETDRRKSHTEFVATHTATGQQIAVEAKSRHRAGVLDSNVPGQKKTNPKAEVIKLLNQALGKDVSHPYVVFIDLNLPFSPAPVFQKQWFQEIHRSIIRQIGDSSPTKQDKFNMVIFTNHPLHYGDDSQPSPQLETGVSLLSKYPKNPLATSAPLDALIKATQLFGNIPRAFPLNAQ